MPYFFSYSIDNLSLTDNVGVSIRNGLVITYDNNYKTFSNSLPTLCVINQLLSNVGNTLYYIPFNDGSEDSVFGNQYTGLYAM